MTTLPELSNQFNPPSDVDRKLINNLPRVCVTFQVLSTIIGHFQVKKVEVGWSGYTMKIETDFID